MKSANTNLESLEFSNKELKKELDAIMLHIEKRGFLLPIDIWKLCELGIPAINILVCNISFDCFKSGLNKWLNGNGK